MSRKKFKWTLTKVIVTILIVAFFLFILFKVGAFDKIIDTLTTSASNVPSSSGSSFGGGGLS